MICHNVELAEIAAHFDGIAIDPPDRCTEPVAYRTRLHREVGDGGVVLTVRAELCDGHDRLLRLDDGYGGSWVVRRDPSRT